ncbi:hypothetical protein BDQ12DRAFT_764554 [Crucibulum laeve]|uniref:F-box domain-containing protein n=1 Tax=Crucibulum laeve TaxID=68775 RepID=A0A5C3LN09_9AGAR|nr:hypothetical protein BDQ12DRAFT_764554 [Crucibulum laeve]
MRDLPRDIWLEIVRFIPPNFSPALYRVNRTLFAIYLDQRYRCVSIGHAKTSRTHHCLLQLKQVLKELHINPHLLGKLFTPCLEQPQESGWLDRLSTSARHLGLLSQHTFRPTADSMQHISYLAKQLRNVTKLHFESEWCYSRSLEFILCTPFIHGGWTAYGSQLHILHWDFPIEAFRLYFPPSLTLEGLEELNLHLFTVEFSANTTLDILNTIISPFVNRHCNTIRHLAIKCFQPWRIGSLLASLKPIPQLRSLDLVYPVLHGVQNPDKFGIHEFLRIYALTLQHFKLQFHSSSTENGPKLLRAKPSWYDQEIFEVPLRNLESLDLGLDGYSLPVISGLTNYLRHFKDPLKRIVLRDHHFLYDDILAISTALTGVRLNSLVIELNHLSPELFDLLSTKFPYLKDLQLMFRVLTEKETYTFAARQNYQHNQLVRDFNDAMESRVYINWNLQHLTMHPERFSCGMLQHCHESIVKSLPGVLSFNSLSREDYLDVYQRQLSDRK